MNLASGDGGQVAGSRSGTFTRPEKLAELDHLDLTERVSISSSGVVASGAFGDIFKSNCYFDGREIPVAVKRLRFYSKEDISTIFKKEIYVWSKLNHNNVLSLLGFAFEEQSGCPLLMSEWMVNGSSWNYVKNNENCDLMRLVTGIAEGLTYLHDNGIVHSDIKPDNIVVTDAGDARICDFGGSRIADTSKNVTNPSTGIRGTQRYIAFELVALPDQNPRHTKESDVWAFGMTVFALFAQEQPYAHLGEAQSTKAIMDRELPSLYFWTARSWDEKTILRNVCHRCWMHNPNARASMNIITPSLRNFISHRNTSRPLGLDARRRRVSSSVVKTNSDTVVISNNIGAIQLNESGYMYEPLAALSSKLAILNSLIVDTSEIYQYLHSAIKAYLSLHDVFVKDFQIDLKLDHLMRAMADVLIFVAPRSTTLSLYSKRQSLIRLLQQAIECCLFVNKYSRKSFEERKPGTTYGRKMSQFISFFVASKEALDLGTSVLPDFVSSRLTHPINESVLRQRLNPDETDMKYQRLCLLGTRVEVQKQIIDWVLSSSFPNILWLHGVAGSGKSTVIASVAEHFRGIYRLGAFLRFTRGASDPSSVISTIAFELALFDFTIGSLILAETDRDRYIENASLSTQLEKLLVEPLCAAAEAQQGPVVVVLDALDECGIPATRRTLIKVLLHGLGRLPYSFKFIITSRREQDIDRAFNALQSGSVTIFELDYTSQVSRSDVQSYLDYEIRSIVEYDDVPRDGWLEKQLIIVGEMAEGLFVWASTFVKLVSEHDSPLEKLAEVASNVHSLSGINQLYSTVLRGSGISWHDVTSKTRFQRVIGLILLSKEPLTENTIDAILGASVGKCKITLSRLRSVIDYRPGESIRLFHASFSDFLMTPGHSKDWFIDTPEQESLLAVRCFEIMKGELRFNICDLRSSFIRNNEVDEIEDRIKSRILPHVSYACRFWSHHLCMAPYGPALFDGLSAFLYNRLLYWLEILSLLENISIAGPTLLATAKWIGINDAGTTTFVKDARRLVTIFALPISQSASHIYISMLPLTADESKVSGHYLLRTSSLVRVTRFGVKRQSPLLKLLDGHTDWITSIDFSSDGSLIASGSEDGTIRIWDTERGELTAVPFKGHISVIRSISFTPDGARIVVGGDFGITVLDAESGSVIVSPFGDAYTTSIAVSPDGKHIVSASSKLIIVWDLESGMIVGEPFVGHTDKVWCGAYSRDGCLIVSGSSDRSVCIWDVERRRLLREPFVGHRKYVNFVSFSPNGKYVVSGSADKDIRIWNIEKGEVDYSPLTGHTDRVNSVVYSSDGTRIVSGSEDKTVRIWNTQNGQLVAGPFKHADPVNCVAISFDGTRVVSGSDDRILRVWDAESGKTDSDSEPERVRDLEAVRFSHDGSCVISDKGTAWRVEDGKVISEGSNETELLTLAITDGMKFSYGGTIKWNRYTGKGTSSSYWNRMWDYPDRIAVSPNGKRIAFGDCKIRIWDRERDVLVWGSFDLEDGYMKLLTFSPNGKQIVSVRRSGIRVWNAETGELLFGPFEVDSWASVISIAYSPDGRHVASCHYDGTVRIWSLETGRSEAFERHAGIARSVSYSPDGSRLVLSSDGSEIRIWNTSTSEALVSTTQDISSNIDLSKWTLDRDGWIRGTHNELFLWIPPVLRSTLCFPPNIAIINNKEGFSTLLDFSGSAQGERWHECFHPQ